MSNNKKEKWLILSDIHSNMDALDVCLKEAKSIGYDKIACLGDLVGYGPNPNEVVKWAKELKESDPSAIFVMGNHDESIADLSISISNYNSSAKHAARIQRGMLLDDTRKFLLELPKMMFDGNIHFVHGSPDCWDEYIHDMYDARGVMSDIKGDICFVGHTHRPEFWKDCAGKLRIVNVGSIGQPRDGDSRACFAMFDTSTQEVKIIRVKYDIASVQEKMKTIKMDNHLINRLEIGQ